MEMRRYHFMGIIKNGLNVVLRSFLLTLSFKNNEAKKQLLPIFRALQTYRAHP